MLFADYARGCVLRFKGDGNNFDFSQPHVVMDGRFVLSTHMSYYYCMLSHFLHACNFRLLFIGVRWVLVIYKSTLLQDISTL